jgi:hypothetical protein
LNLSRRLSAQVVPPYDLALPCRHSEEREFDGVAQCRLTLIFGETAAADAT